MAQYSASDLRIQKRRSEAGLCLTTGEMVHGNFFTSGGSPLHAGPERIGDLLNADSGFFPFERRDEDGLRTMILNRAHVISVAVSRDEPRQEPGYGVARRQAVSMLLSTGERVTGSISVYRPEGHNRLSDWSKSRDAFLYLETDDGALLVNRAHIVEIFEMQS